MTVSCGRRVCRSYGKKNEEEMVGEGAIRKSLQ